MIRKAVIPAAGFGTRFLPAAKSQPKEMLPIVDTPVIQYVVEEAAAAGIRDILMIIGKGKRAIEEHFDRNVELEAELEEKGKAAELESIRRLSSLANIHFVWQKELNGLGDAITYASDHVGREPFAVLLGDTLVESGRRPVTRQLMDVTASIGGKFMLTHEGGYSAAYVPFCGLAILEEITGHETPVEDPYLPIFEGIGGQDLQPHQAAVIDQAAALVERVPA